MPMKRDFGTVRRLPSGRWQARWTDPVTGERCKAPDTFGTRGEALQYLALLRTGGIDPHKGKRVEGEDRTVGAIIAEVLKIEGPGLGRATLYGYQSALRNQVGYIAKPETAKEKQAKAEGIAFIDVFTLDREDVIRWLVNLRDRGCSRATMHKAFVLLRKGLRELIENGVLDKDPTVGLSKRKALWTERPEPTHDYLSPDEIDALRTATPERYRALIEVLAWGGLRISEAFALTRKDVLLKSGQLLINKSHSEIGGALTVEPTKSRKIRRVSLGEESMRIVRDHLDNHVADDPDALLFTSQRGNALRYSNFRHRVFTPTATKIGHPKLTPHDLRATCATNLFALGWQVKDVQQHLGHATPDITLAIYTMFLESGRKPNVSKIDEVRRATAATEGEDAA